MRVVLLLAIPLSLSLSPGCGDDDGGAGDGPAALVDGARDGQGGGSDASGGGDAGGDGAAAGSCAPQYECLTGPLCGLACCPAGHACDPLTSECRCGDGPACGVGDTCERPGPVGKNACGTICCGASGPCPQ